MRSFPTVETLVAIYWRKLAGSARPASKPKSGGALPHSKTRATNRGRQSRPRFGVRQRFAALRRARQTLERPAPQQAH
jgi:hypothetical protein